MEKPTELKGELSWEISYAALSVVIMHVFNESHYLAVKKALLLLSVTRQHWGAPCALFSVWDVF